MTTNSRYLLAALVVVLSVGLALRATDAPAKRTTGHVLVLVNERTLEGDVERQGDQYRVRRAIGEVWVPGNQVLCLCDSREEALAYLREHANLSDPDERLRLAHWCQLNNLRKQALEEVSAAVQLRPGDAESRRLQRSLQRSLATAQAPPTASAAEKMTSDPASGPSVDLNSESLSQFVTRVQPILMNACANCHATGKGGAFQLTRAFPGEAANRKTVQQNAAAVVAQLNPAQPQLSPFLVKAQSIHGDAPQPPLRGKDTPAFRTLEEWVTRTVATNPQLQGRMLAAASVADVKPATEAAPVRGDASATEAVAKPPPSAFAADKPAEAPKAAPPAPADPFDPDVFNRETHPVKDK